MSPPFPFSLPLWLFLPLVWAAGFAVMFGVIAFLAFAADVVAPRLCRHCRDLTDGPCVFGADRRR